MAIVTRQTERQVGLWIKMKAVTLLGLCLIFVWTVFSSLSSTDVTFQRESFEDISAPVSSSSSNFRKQITQSALLSNFKSTFFGCVRETVGVNAMLLHYLRFNCD